ncbi:MAG: BMP family ABC transporter substrate-binding protein [Firmicutes bacterium]|nr:BMP family ABC transporter substrate-binding protein [Dethiobacter sp.]MBS3889641.1 BMP family ABC transporter substrate-binding protein [Bacillota bacterium]MBS4054627.1 BMP family ABC transporter substrate-binding protein [Thermaerobacter sp.]
MQKGNTKLLVAAVVALVLIVALAFILPGMLREPEPEPVAFRVGVVLSTGGRGDNSFNDAAIVGLEKAVAELGIEFSYQEPAEVPQMEEFHRLFAQEKMDLIIGVGFLQADAITKVAQEFPEQKWAVVDTVIDLPNVKSLVFREHEGSFLAGALANMMTETNNVGFVGGMQIPLITRFKLGYMHGVEHVNALRGRNVTVQSAYIGTTGAAFRDPGRGKELALAQIAQGADIIYHAAGGSGQGVFEAAAEKGVKAIGVDSNQNWVKPGSILASMMKRVDVAVFDAIKATKEGTFAAGATSFGVKEGGIGLTDLAAVTDVEKAALNNDAAQIALIQAMKDAIPADVRQLIADLSAQIADGRIVVRSE